MLSSLAAPVLLFLSRALALPAGEPDACATETTWTIKDFESSTSDSVGNDGTAEFKLTNDVTNVTDELTCTLEANYRCTITGTPSDENLTVMIAIRSASLTLTLDQVVDCPDTTSLVHIIANADLELGCTPADAGEAYTCSLDEDTVQGKVVELAPDPNGS